MKFYVPTTGGEFRPAELMEWAEWNERHTIEPFLEGGRVVARDELPGQVSVSTVFLGLNHRYVGEGDPLVFETMIFGGPHDGSQWRYTTYNAALAGHDQALARAEGAG